MADTAAAYNHAHRIELRRATAQFAEDTLADAIKRARQNKEFNNQRAVDSRACYPLDHFKFSNPASGGLCSTSINGSTNSYSSGTAPRNQFFPDASRVRGGTLVGGVITPATLDSMYNERLAGLKRQREEREAEGVEDNSDATAKPMQMEGEEAISTADRNPPSAVDRTAVAACNDALRRFLQNPNDAALKTQIMETGFGQGALAYATVGELTRWQNELNNRAYEQLTTDPDVKAFFETCKTQAAFALHRGADDRRTLLDRTEEALRRRVPPTPAAAAATVTAAATTLASASPAAPPAGPPRVRRALPPPPTGTPAAVPPTAQPAAEEPTVGITDLDYDDAPTDSRTNTRFNAWDDRNDSHSPFDEEGDTGSDEPSISYSEMTDIVGGIVDDIIKKKGRMEEQWLQRAPLLAKSLVARVTPRLKHMLEEKQHILSTFNDALSRFPASPRVKLQPTLEGSDTYTAKGAPTPSGKQINIGNYSDEKPYSYANSGTTVADSDLGTDASVSKSPPGSGNAARNIDSTLAETYSSQITELENALLALARQKPAQTKKQRDKHVKYERDMIAKIKASVSSELPKKERQVETAHRLHARLTNIQESNAGRAAANAKSL